MAPREFLIRIDHIGMPARDAKASAHFLRDALGLHEAEPESAAFLHEAMQQHHTIFVNAENHAGDTTVRQPASDLPQFAPEHRGVNWAARWIPTLS